MGENFTFEGIHYDDLSFGRKLLVREKEDEDRAIIKIVRVCNPCDELLAYGKRVLHPPFGIPKNLRALEL